MTKYYIRKNLIINVNDDENKYSISFDDMLTMYDDKNKLLNHIKKQEIIKFKKNYDSVIDLDLDTFESRINKKTFNIKFETKSFDMGNSSEAIMSIDDGICTKIQNDHFYLECSDIIYEIEEENIIYALIESNTDENFEKIHFVYDFIEFREDLPQQKDFYKFRNKDKYCQYAIFDKQLLKQNQIYADDIVSGYLEGKITDYSLSFFDENTLKTAFLNNSKNIRTKFIELKKENESNIEKLKKWEEIYENADIDDKKSSQGLKECDYCKNKDKTIIKLQKKLYNIENVLNEFNNIFK